MSENTAPEPSQDEVEELIEEIEVHGLVQPGLTNDCTDSCASCTCVNC